MNKTDADLVAEFLASKQIKRVPQGARGTRFTNREFYMLTRDDYRSREEYKAAPVATAAERAIAESNRGILSASHSNKW